MTLKEAFYKTIELLEKYYNNDKQKKGAINEKIK